MAATAATAAIIAFLIFLVPNLVVRGTRAGRRAVTVVWWQRAGRSHRQAAADVLEDSWRSLTNPCGCAVLPTVHGDRGPGVVEPPRVGSRWTLSGITHARTRGPHPPDLSPWAFCTGNTPGIAPGGKPDDHAPRSGNFPQNSHVRHGGGFVRRGSRCATRARAMTAVATTSQPRVCS